VGNNTTISYDNLGRKTSMSDPDMGSWSYGYDVNSNLITQTDALNQTISFSYDALSRLITKTYPAGSPATYSYDAGTNGKGQRTGMSNTNGNTSWTYDNRGRVITTTTSVTGLSGSRSFGNSYDSAGRITSLTYPSLTSPTTVGETINYGYDYAWRLTSASSSLGTYVSGTSYGFDSSNHLNQKQWTLGNGLIQTWNYNTLGELSQLRVGPSATLGSLFNRTYSYDNIGDVSGIINVNNSSENHQYSYDDLNRLKSWTLGGSTTENYSYDTIGNITNKVAASYNYTATVGTRTLPHAVSQTVNGGTTQTYSYDANGNMLTGGGRSYTWNYDNKPSSITGTDGVTETYAYDADGARVKRTRAGVTTYYVGGTWEEDSSGARKQYYLFGTQVIAQRDSSNTLTYIHGDHLGSTSLTTSSSGASVSQQEFDPWGKVRSGGVSQTSMNYTGQKLDGTGLLFYNARYYDPTLGRFSSADIVEDGLNRYSYVGNNPINATDPSGNDACDSGSDKYKEVCNRLGLGYDPGGLKDWADESLAHLSMWLGRNIKFEGFFWNEAKLQIVMEGLDRVNNAFEGKTDKILGIGVYGVLSFNLGGTVGVGTVGLGENKVNLNNDQFTFDGPNENHRQFLIETVVHELGHVADRTAGRGREWWSKSGSAWQKVWKRVGDGDDWEPTMVGSRNFPSSYASTSPMEDFAETFTYIVHTRSEKNSAGWTNQRHLKNPEQTRITALNVALGI